MNSSNSHDVNRQIRGGRPARPKPNLTDSADCPDLFVLQNFSLGKLNAGEHQKVSEHVNVCRFCALALRELAACENEEGDVSLLPSSRRVEQQRIAKRLSRMPSVSTVWSRVAAVIGFSIAVSAAWYIWGAHSRNPNDLIASAFAARRPFDYKFDAAIYGPVRSRRSLAAKPLTNLSELRLQTEQELKSEPDNPALLARAGRISALALEFPVAVDRLEKAHKLEKGELAIGNDLAVVLAARGQLEDSRPQLERALALLKEVLARQPGNWTARLNSGLVLLQLGHNKEAGEEWRLCLREALPSDWRREIEGRLRSLQ